VINEVLAIDNNIREAVLNKMPAGEIKKLAMQSGMTTMIVNGFKKASRGLTTIEEVLRAIHE
jgi:general secretion pathway protein E